MEKFYENIRLTMIKSTFPKIIVAPWKEGIVRLDLDKFDIYFCAGPTLVLFLRKFAIPVEEN